MVGQVSVRLYVVVRVEEAAGRERTVGVLPRSKKEFEQDLPVSML